MSASGVVPWVSEARSPPAGVDDETLVLLLGVLNLAGLFVYSAYNFVQDKPRLRSTYDRYVDGQVRRVLDDLVMRVHQTAYFSGLLETARSAGRGLGGAAPQMDFSRLEVLAADFPFPAAPGRQLAWLRRLNVTRAERTALAGALPVLSALRQLPAQLRRGLRELAQPQPALAGQQQRAYAGLVHLASRLRWPSELTQLDAGQLRFFKSKWRKKPLTAKQEAALRRKSAALERQGELWEEIADAAGDGADPAEDGEVWTGSHWTDRWYELASQVTPVLLDAGNGYALSRRRPHCLAAVVCRLNADWKPQGAVQASLSPLVSLLLGWWLQDLGAGITLEDALVAVRAGWLQRSCSDLYPRCHAVRGAEPPPDLLTTTATSTATTPASPADRLTTTPPHSFFWALSSLLKNPVPRPKTPLARPPPPPPPTTTSLPPVIVGRLPPAGDEPLTALEGDHVPEVDWGGAPPVEPPPVATGWDRNQAVAWNRVDLGGSGGPPWDEFGGHGGKSPIGRPREVAGAGLSYRRPERRQELWQDHQQPEAEEQVADYQPEHQSDQWPERSQDQELEYRLDQRPDQKPVQRPDQIPDQRPDQRPNQRLDQRPDQTPDQRPDQRLDQRLDQKPDQRPDQRPDERLDQRPDRRPDQRPDRRPEQRPDQTHDRKPEQPLDSGTRLAAAADQEPAAASQYPYQGGHLIPGSLSGDSSGGQLPGALFAIHRRPGRPYRPIRRGYVADYGSDVLSGVQQSYAGGGAAPTEAVPTTLRPGLVLDAPAPAQLLPGRYRLGLRRGLPSGGSGGVQGVLPVYAERRRPATAPEPRRRWLPPPAPTAAPPVGERRRTWVQFGPQDGVTDAARHKSLYSYVRDRSVRRLWAHG